MGEVLSEKVVKRLRLQNPGSGQVHGTMFGREEGVGPLLAARPGQVLGGRNQRATQSSPPSSSSIFPLPEPGSKAIHILEN